MCTDLYAKSVAARKSISGGEAGSTNLSERVYQEVRADIVNGRIRPNERLVEAEVSERLNVSRTPLREALQLLAADGLIHSRRRGWVVSEHTHEDVREIYETRSALEGFAARLAAERASKQEVGAIAATHDAWAAAARAGEDPGRLVALNDEFFDEVVTAAHNTRLAKTIQRTRSHYFNQRVASLYDAKDVAAAIKLRKALVSALRQRDGDAAERVTREMIDLSLQVLLAKGIW
jgi:DNA-binding GntR family transcriptional regulator